MLATGTAAVEQRRMDYVRLQRQVPAITDVSWLDGDGREQLRVSRLAMDVVGSGIDQSRDPKFVQARADKTYFSPISFRKESEPYLTIAVAGPGASGVTVADVNLKFIWDVVSQIQIGKAGHAYVVDVTGQLIAHPDISLVLKRTDLSALAAVKAARARAGRSSQGERPSSPGISRARQVLTAFAPVVPLGWYVLVEQPLVEAFGPIRASILRTTIVAARRGRPGRAGEPAPGPSDGAPDPGPPGWRRADRHGRSRASHRRPDRRRGRGARRRFNRMGARLQESYAGLERKVEERTRELRGRSCSSRPSAR